MEKCSYTLDGAHDWELIEEEEKENKEGDMVYIGTYECQQCDDIYVKTVYPD